MLYKITILSLLVSAICAQNLPSYIKKQCHSSDPKLIDCIIEDVNHLKPFLKDGIPEIQMPSVEPFRINEIALTLGGEITTYRIALKDLDVFGASNFTLSKIKLGKPFEAKLKMPQLNIYAKYLSSGQFFLFPAGGEGRFQAVFDGVTATLKGSVIRTNRNGETYLQVENLTTGLIVKNNKMTVSRIFNNNRILIDAINLFLKENGQEVLKIMSSQLSTQLSKEFKRIVNQLLVNVPLHRFYIED